MIISYVRSGLNSHYFHIIGDGHQPNSRVYRPIIRIPIKGGMTIPNIATFDHGTYASLRIPSRTNQYFMECQPRVLNIAQVISHSYLFCEICQTNIHKMRDVIYIPSLMLTASLPLKIDGRRNHPFWGVLAHVHGLLRLLMLVLGRVYIGVETT